MENFKDRLYILYTLSINWTRRNMYIYVTWIIIKIDVSVDSFNGPTLINTKLIKVRLLQITMPFSVSCHFINLKVFSIHIDNFPKIKYDFIRIR